MGIIKCGIYFQEYDDVMSTDMVSFKLMKCVPGGRVAKEWDGFFNICSMSTASNTFKDWLHSYVWCYCFCDGRTGCKFCAKHPRSCAFTVLVKCLPCSSHCN